MELIVKRLLHRALTVQPAHSALRVQQPQSSVVRGTILALRHLYVLRARLDITVQLIQPCLRFAKQVHFQLYKRLLVLNVLQVIFVSLVQLE